MANFGKRPQPYRVEYPITPAQVENIDQMFEILFKRIGQVQTELQIATSGTETASGQSFTPMLAGSFTDEAEPALMPVPGPPGPQGPPGPAGLWMDAPESDPALIPYSVDPTIFAYLQGTNPFTGSVSIANNPLDLLVGQIKFPASQNASANANTLDDYEEGTWTPVLAGVGGTSGQTYTIQSGHYVKIGQLVYVDCVVLTSVLGTLTGNVIISGLPFTSLNSGYLRTPCTINWFAITTNIIVMQGTIVENSAQLDIFISTAATNSLVTNPVQADFANGNAISFCVCYRANA
jgi:hypothetical protein